MKSSEIDDILESIEKTLVKVKKNEKSTPQLLISNKSTRTSYIPEKGELM